MTRPLDQLKRVGWIGWIAVAVALLAVTVLVRGLVAIGGALLAPSAGRSAAKQDERLTQAADEYSKSVDQSLAQIDGRSIFFVPSPPIPPPPPPPPIVETEPPPPPKPSTYGGPAIIAMVNDAVWLSDGTKLIPGQPADSADVRVVRIEMPWHAVLEWKGVEFQVSLFDRDSTVIKDAPTQTPTTPPEGPGDTPAPPANDSSTQEPAAPSRGQGN